MDNSHVALVAVKLLADGFRQYRCVSSRVFIFLTCGASLCSTRALLCLASSLSKEANACHGHCWHPLRRLMRVFLVSVLTPSLSTVTPDVTARSLSA